MGAHLDEGRMQRLLHGQANPAELAQIREHLAMCVRCTQRVREWAPLFPQAADVLPMGERLPPPLPGAAPRVVVPDGQAYAGPHRRATLRRVAGALTLVGLAVAAFLLRDRVSLPGRQEAARLPETLSPPPSQPMVLPRDSTVFSAPADTGTLPDTTLTAGNQAGSPTPQPAVPPAQPARQPPPAPSPVDSIPATDTAQTITVPDPDSVRSVTLGDALQALGGEVRLLQGITPDRVELVPSREVPGATAGVPVVRISYRNPAGGTMVLEEQRLPSREGPGEPQVALDSVAGGYVATWVDRAGFRLRITVPGDQSMALRMVNRVQ